MMLLKEVFRGWLQKFSYAFLIFCIGGMDSLIYFDGFLPGHEHGLHPYHLSIWTEPVHHHNPLPPPSQSNILTLLTTTYQNTTQGVTCSCHLSPSNASLLTITQTNFFIDSPFFNRIFASSVVGRSIWLSPPDKPPQLYFS
ncbi:MAG: hypothetical protein KJ077_02300 [Anaerolineae bacterium]|nr:hypothetical protein [Anaerolineae bacterium]